MNDNNIEEIQGVKLIKVINGIAIFIYTDYRVVPRIPLSKLTEVYLHNKIYKKYMDVNYADLYTPLELDINIAKNVYQLVREKIDFVTMLTQFSVKESLLIELQGLSMNSVVTELSAIEGENTYAEAPEEQKIAAGSIINYIFEQYANNGYKWHYFRFVKEDNPLYMAKMQKIELKPDIFEAIAEAPTNYAQNLQNLKIRRGTWYWTRNRTHNELINYTRWRKQDLYDAIKKSGLLEPENAKTLGLPLVRAGPTAGRVRAFGKFPSERYVYYETMYRYLFNTLTYVNWGKICKLNLVTLKDLRYIANSEFGIPNSKAQKLSYGDICETINLIAEQKRNVSKHLVELIPFQAEAIKFYPESPWVNPITRYQFKGGSNKLTKPYQQFMAVKSWCEDDDVTKEDFVDLLMEKGMRYLLPEKLTKYSKADLCQYLLDVLYPQAEKYENLFFDCSNPAINKRNIINSLMIMELGGILPENSASLSKDQLCEIVNNYIEILLSAKELRFADSRI